MRDEPRVFVVDDDPAMRDSLRYLLESAAYKVSLYASAEEFLAQFRPEAPGCVLLDVRMPGGMGGLQLLDHLQAIEARIPVVLFTGHGDVPMAVNALKAGAFDFVEKPPVPQQLLGRIGDAMQVDRKRRDNLAEFGNVGEHLSRLTPRERGVLQRLVEGESTKGIAAELCLSEKTIEKYRASIMEKMEVRSLAKLIRMVLLHDRTSHS
jgi:two-component system, LuxR family, response regulator FixJ